eukprot:gnl/Dysnectes_brevis/4669_a6384_712.p1 GENE.gnl/Dysnectes_brevis/4669_a6384_712~~gnl/Dysnectes_brevis/4669_a6384_712.p1  ORF type:complete len:208 (-),score=9.53 gnl/Dysnectes_brevis/4669_a6384_712:47-670(-)
MRVTFLYQHDKGSTQQLKMPGKKSTRSLSHLTIEQRSIRDRVIDKNLANGNPSISHTFDYAKIEDAKKVTLILQPPHYDIIPWNVTITFPDSSKHTFSGVSRLKSPPTHLNGRTLSLEQTLHTALSRGVRRVGTLNDPGGSFSGAFRECGNLELDTCVGIRADNGVNRQLLLLHPDCALTVLCPGSLRCVGESIVVMETMEEFPDHL